MFRQNPNLDRELKANPDFQKMRADTARTVIPAVVAATPKGKTGAAGRSIDVIVDGDIVGIGSSDPFWHLIEWGSVNNPPYAPLRSGIRAAGLRFEENH